MPCDFVGRRLRMMIERATGKLSPRDERTSQLLSWAPWLSFVVVTLPVPIVFLVLFLTATATDSAAIYLLLSFVSMGLGLVVGLLVVILLLFYRRRWRQRLRERLAVDGITAAEVEWFASELSSEERKTWRELKAAQPAPGRCLLRNTGRTPDRNQNNRQSARRDLKD